MSKRSVEQWQALFAEQVASGLSARQFCLQRGLCPRHFSLRRQRLSAVAPAGFVRLQPQRCAAEPQSAATVVLRYGGSTLELGGVSPAWVSQLLMALA